MREHLIRLIENACDGCPRYKAEDIADTLISEGVIGQVRHGEWRLETDEECANPMFKLVVCSCCGERANNTYHYCPSCGAEMIAFRQ